jgi:hypothetical protein
MTIGATYDVPLTTELRPAERRAGRLRQLLGKAFPIVAWDRINWRTVFGLWPYVQHISIVHHYETNSYHFRYAVDDDQYVYDVRLVRSTAGNRDDTVRVTHTKPESQALSYAHLYLKAGLHTGHPESQVYVRLDTRERPPGVLGTVAVVATIQALVVLGITIYYQRIFHGHHRLTGDIPALLVAIPGLFSAWIASQLTPRRLQGTAFSSIGGMAFNGLLAILGSVLAIVSSVGSDHPAVHLFWDSVNLPHPEWFLLLTLCTWNSLNLSLRWWQNTRLVIRRLRERPALAHYSV